MSKKTKFLRVTFNSGETYAVPVAIIAQNRAAYYAGKEYGGDVARSLAEDTGPLFDSDDYEIEDWASNNMDWSELGPFATLVDQGDGYDYDSEWPNAGKEIETRLA